MQYFSLHFGIFIVSFMLCFINSGAVVKAPNFINPCNSTNPQCLKRAVENAIPDFIRGVPELEIVSLDPFMINNLKLMLPGGLKIELRQGSMRGMKSCLVESVTMVDDLLDLRFRCNITIKGKYRSSGRLLMFAIDGDGDSLIKCRDLKVHYMLKLGRKLETDGQPHIEIQSYQTKHTYEGRVFYRMTNLLKGNPMLSNIVVEFMNRNWKMVAEEFGDPIIDYGIQKVMHNIKKLFKKVPMDQLVGFRIA